MDVKELIEQFDNFIGNAELGEKEGQLVEDFLMQKRKKLRKGHWDKIGT